MTENSVPDELREEPSKVKRRKKAKQEVAFTHDGSVAAFPLERFKQFAGFVKIQSRDYGLVPFVFLGTQKYLLEEICDGIENGITTFVILKARQVGISTFLLLLDLFWAMEHEGLLGTFATHEEASRDQFRNQIEVFFQTIPSSHRVGYTLSNKTMLVLENNSLFRYLTAGTRGSTNKLGRSGGSNFLHATEVAFWGSGDDLSALNQTLSEIYPHRLYFYESTANGFNHFAEMCDIAKDSPAQKFIFIAWWRDERYEFGSNHPLLKKYMPQGAKTGLTAHERKMVQVIREDYNYQLTSGQMAWYRHHLETKCNGDLQQMMQEMPSTPEEAFVSTGAQFFTNEGLTNQMREARKTTCMPFVFKLTKNPADTQLANSTIQKAELKIWEMPNQYGKYVVSCDPAYGSNDESDGSCIFVGRCYADRLVQVAEFCTNAMQPYEIAWVLAYICGLYREVMLILEINNSGHAVYGELRRMRTIMRSVASPEEMDLRNTLLHMKEYLYKREDSLGGGMLKQWVTSSNNKIQMMERYKANFETGRVLIRSMSSLEEHRRIERKDGYIQGKENIAGHGNTNDDRVIAAGLATYAWDQWIRIEMMAKGRTYEKEKKVEAAGGPSPVSNLLQKFAAIKGISLPDELGDE